MQAFGLYVPPTLEVEWERSASATVAASALIAIREVGICRINGTDGNKGPGTGRA